MASNNHLGVRAPPLKDLPVFTWLFTRRVVELNIESVTSRTSASLSRQTSGGVVVQGSERPGSVLYATPYYARLPKAGGAHLRVHVLYPSAQGWWDVCMCVRGLLTGSVRGHLACSRDGRHRLGEASTRLQKVCF